MWFCGTFKSFWAKNFHFNINIPFYIVKNAMYCYSVQSLVNLMDKPNMEIKQHYGGGLSFPQLWADHRPAGKMRIMMLGGPTQYVYTMIVIYNSRVKLTAT